MNTYATDGRKWTETELDALNVENQFRLRGLEVTRLDTFVDAAFAFVLTLLVISFDDIPSDYPEMLAAVQQIPGFAASFAVLMMFWRQHRTWSRRYGIENSHTIFYSLTLIFVVLVYVYPLRMIFEGLFANITGGYLSTSYQINSYQEIRMIFVFYSVGFLSMSLLIALLYRAAKSSSVALNLNHIELRKTNIEMQVWMIATCFGLLSIVLALSLPDTYVSISAYMYFGLIPLMWIPAFIDKRRDQALSK